MMLIHGFVFAVYIIGVIVAMVRDLGFATVDGGVLSLMTEST